MQEISFGLYALLHLLTPIICFMLSSHFVSSSYTATACYGTNKECDYIYLNCSSHGTIHILKAEYLFNNNSVCQPQGLSCDTKKGNGCCDQDEGNSPTNFTDKNMTTLIGNCSERIFCESQAPWTSRTIKENGTDKLETSTMVIVEYICQPDVSPPSRSPAISTIHGNGTTNSFTNALQTGLQTDTTAGYEPLTDSEETNTAAIVIPIIAVVLIIAVAILVFLYWRRKRQKENGEKGEDQTNHVVRESVQNPGYFGNEKVTQKIKDINNGYPAPENAYNTIDSTSVIDRKHAAANDYLDLDPENEYNTIEPNSMDSKTKTTNEYFILEPEAQNPYQASSDKDYDYNKINLKAHGIVKDPNYQRLASVDQCPKDEAKIDSGNYSHIGDKLSVEGKDGQMQSVSVENNDYAHVNNKDQI